jgi:hypothetical protein
VAVLALLLAIDARTLHQAGRFAGLRDTWLLAGAAAICAASARRMLLAPTEHVWAVLAVSAAAVFSLAFHMARNASATEEGWVLIALLVLCGALLWRFLIEPGHVVWQMLIAGCAVLGAFVIARAVSPQPDCDRTVLGFLGYILGTGPCFDRSTLGGAAIWSITAVSFVAAALALSLPLIESYSRQRATTAG